MKKLSNNSVRKYINWSDNKLSGVTLCRYIVAPRDHSHISFLYFILAGVVSATLFLKFSS
jgi:hypothetical protein